MRSFLEKGEAWDGREMRGMRWAICGRKAARVMEWQPSVWLWEYINRGYSLQVSSVLTSIFFFYDMYTPYYLRQQWHSCLLSCPAVSNNCSWGHSPCPRHLKVLEPGYLLQYNFIRSCSQFQNLLVGSCQKYSILVLPIQSGRERTFQNPYITWE